MLRTVADFCAYLYPDGTGGERRRRLYRLFRLADERRRAASYRAVMIPKRSGGERTLRVPSERMKRIQRGLLPLLADGAVSPCAAGYVRGKSVLDNAAPHVGQALVLKLDIEDFFGSIRFTQVYHAIDRALRQSPLVGCGETCGRSYNGVLSQYFSLFCTLGGVLPQGAPSSPMLSNLVFEPIDRIFLAYSEKHGLAYTRYCDDLTFSGALSPRAVTSFARRILSQNGFCLREDKIVAAGRGRCQRITGVVVNRKMQAGKEYRRAIRQELYFIEKYGVREHLLRQKESPFVLPGGRVRERRYLQGLLGRVSFVLQINPEDAVFAGYRETLKGLIRRDAALRERLAAMEARWDRPACGVSSYPP